MLRARNASPILSLVLTATVFAGCGGGGSSSPDATSDTPSGDVAQGSGGVTGSGGVAGSGGTAASGGTTASGSGGASASGGNTGSGGVSGSGGGSASGGTTGSGGVNGSGGATASGGTTGSGGAGSGGVTGSGGTQAARVVLNAGGMVVMVRSNGSYVCANPRTTDGLACREVVGGTQVNDFSKTLSFAMNATSVYVTGGTSSTLMSTNKLEGRSLNGTSWTYVYSGDRYSWPALLGSEIFFIGGVPIGGPSSTVKPSLLKVALAGGAAPVPLVDLTAFPPVDYNAKITVSGATASNGTNIFYIDGTSVKRTTTSGTLVGTLYSDATYGPLALEADATHVYFSTSTGVHRVLASGASAPELVLAGTRPHFAIDATGVFVAFDTGIADCSTPTIKRVDKTTGAVADVNLGNVLPSCITAMAADDRYVYAGMMGGAVAQWPK